MHIEEHDQGGDHVVALSGRITIDSSPELRLLLLKRITTPGRDSLTIDFSETAYIDTSALAVLLETLRVAHHLGKAFQLSGLHGRPRYLLEATGFIRLFSEIPQQTSR
jgi:anti-sigma B factor antagonist